MGFRNVQEKLEKMFLYILLRRNSSLQYVQIELLEVHNTKGIINCFVFGLKLFMVWNCLWFERLHTTHPAWWEDLRKKPKIFFEQLIFQKASLSNKFFLSVLGCVVWRAKKSDNLQYNTLGRWVDRLINQASDGPSIILIDWK